MSSSAGERAQRPLACAPDPLASLLPKGELDVDLGAERDGW
ncbi:hypothetical protein WMF37_45725 [Sorangium sp. So ce291]